MASCHLPQDAAASRDRPGRVKVWLLPLGHVGAVADVSTPGSARFAQAAIARVGQAIALAVGEVVQALFEAVLPC